MIRQRGPNSNHYHPRNKRPAAGKTHMTIRNKMDAINFLYSLIFRRGFPKPNKSLARMLCRLNIDVLDFRWTLFNGALVLWDLSNHFRASIFDITTLETAELVFGLFFTALKMATASFPSVVVAFKHTAALLPRSEARMSWKRSYARVERVCMLAWATDKKLPRGWMWKDCPRTPRERMQLINWALCRKAELPVQLNWKEDSLSQWAIQFLETFLNHRDLHAQLEELTFVTSGNPNYHRANELVRTIRRNARESLFHATAPSDSISQKVWVQRCILFLKQFGMLRQEGWPDPLEDDNAHGRATHVWAGLVLIRLLSELVDNVPGLFRFYPEMLDTDAEIKGAWECFRRVCRFSLGDGPMHTIVQGIEEWNKGQKASAVTAFRHMSKKRPRNCIDSSEERETELVSPASGLSAASAGSSGSDVDLRRVKSPRVQGGRS